MLAVVAASTLDYVAGEVRLGGPAYYIATAFQYLGSQALLLTTRSSVSRYLSELNQLMGVIEAGSGETVFEIELRKNGDGRVLRVLRRSRFDMEILVKAVRKCDSVLISTTYDELDPKDLVELTRGRKVVVDIQGFVREVDRYGKVVLDPRKVFEVGKYLDGSTWRIIRGEREEFPIECWVDPLKCAEKLRADIIMTDGARPLTVFTYRDRCLYEVEPPPGFYGEPIGLGDVFTAVLAHHLFVEKFELLEAAVMASAAAALKLRGRHPWFTVQELDALKRKVGIRRKAC